MGKVLAACLLLSAQTYGLPPAVLLGIYQVEGGQVGQEVGPNNNGSYDIGPMQINTIWLPTLAKEWGIGEEAARRLLRDDPCTNVRVSAWILRGHFEETGNLAKAVEYYHSRTPHRGKAYKNRVVASMESYGLVNAEK